MTPLTPAMLWRFTGRVAMGLTVSVVLMALLGAWLGGGRNFRTAMEALT